MRAQSQQRILHNEFAENTSLGVQISNVSGVQLLHNTFYAPQGDNVRIDSRSRNVEIRNNVLWAQAGYNVYVANDSQAGFFSDFNLLHASDQGKLIFWSKDFTDILDWQADVALFDLHSSGTTRLNPVWSEPRFAHREWHNFAIFEPVAGLRHTSPSIALGDPRLELSFICQFADQFWL